MKKRGTNGPRHADKTCEFSLPPVCDRIGVTHAAALYAFDSSAPVLVEGARYIAEMGAKTIKLWLTASAVKNYCLHTDWTQFDTSSALALLKTPPYRAVLDMDFHAYIFETHEFDQSGETDWANGMTEERQTDVEDKLFEIAAYLMQAYRGRGKTFVLQNWEGDNMLGSFSIDCVDGKYIWTDGRKQKGDSDAEIRLRIQGLTDWFNARQRGVDRARAAFGQLGVRVDHAVELNAVPLASDGFALGAPYLIDSVLPFIDPDMVSFSSWQTNHMALNAHTPSVETLLPRLQRIKAAAGAEYLAGGGTATPRRNPVMRIMLGEYGRPEGLQHEQALWQDGAYDAVNDRFQRLIALAQLETAVLFGCEYILYWEMLCNEVKHNAKINTLLGEQAQQNEQVNGYYLIRPDGSRTGLYHAMRPYMGQRDTLAVDENEIGDVRARVFSVDCPLSFVHVTLLLEATGLSNNNASPARPQRAEFDKKLRIRFSTDGKHFGGDEEMEAVLMYERAGKSGILFTNKAAIPPDVKAFCLSVHSDKHLHILSVRAHKADSGR